MGSAEPAKGGGVGIDQVVTLNNGVQMPVLGLGVWQAERGNECRQAVLWALEAGYRHIDTARIYGNEKDVGAAIRESGLPRGEIFVTTKLWNSDQGYEKALRAFDHSLTTLDLDYVDLYLIHWPAPGTRDDSWRALQRILEEGRVRAIGVSNYTDRHLAELLSWADVPPSVDQIEFSPFLYQADLLEYCRAHGIQLEAYSPLTRGRQLKDEKLTELARHVGRTPAQVLIRWALQHDVVVIPKSVRHQRILENAAVFDFSLSAKDMAALDALDDSHRFAWDPSAVE
jgi:diketogulonate reductase-like aldo/keto reductase